MRLAMDLGKTLAEIRRMPQAEYILWMGYYLHQAQERDMAERKAAAKSKAANARRR